MKVYEAINKVQAELAKVGIAKDSKNQMQGYKFRGIDAVYSALSPLLAQHGLLMLPRVLNRTCEERQTAKGGTLFFVTVDTEFDLVSAEDGTKHTIRTFGEAMDSADKATNKAMSAAYKYAAFMAFAIPTEGDNDADAHTHDVAPKQTITPTKSAYDNLSPDMQIFVKDCVAEINRLLAEKGVPTVAEYLATIPKGEQSKAVWAALDASLKTKIKEAA